MKAVIKTEKDLERYIDKYYDHDPEINYLVMDTDGLCYVVFGCTYASEAFRFVNDEYSLVITDDDYDEEIEKQNNSENPEMCGFELTER